MLILRHRHRQNIDFDFRFRQTRRPIDRRHRYSLNLRNRNGAANSSGCENQLPIERKIFGNRPAPAKDIEALRKISSGSKRPYDLLILDTSDMPKPRRPRQMVSRKGSRLQTADLLKPFFRGNGFLTRSEGKSKLPDNLRHAVRIIDQ